MSTHKYIGRICWAALALVLAVTALLLGGEALGIQAASPAAGYETRLFDASRVHTIDIVMDDWEGFLAECENEEYQLCSLVIDGESCKNAAIRAKGNSSLTSVAAYGSDRYSFKVEFDRYDGVSTYHGLDKLNLNNIIQDNTYLKDFLSYRLMDAFGVASPLCSYVYVSVNGEEWGLYLAVEGVEDAFLDRNYGADAGNLYKPDSMDFGGGRGNGRDFDFGERAGDAALPSAGSGEEAAAGPPEGGEPERKDFGGGSGGGFGGMGSADVKLQYVDDDPDSYANIFDNAKTDITKADKKRLIAALEKLGGEDAAGAVDAEQVIRYFVVHGFLCNGDSYTGSMVHNYYLYEKDGVLSMIPWDYNLAFGGFQSSDAAGTVNEPIDTPVSGGALSDRPMIAWIFDSEAYTALYHQYYQAFLDQCLESGWLRDLVDSTAAMIAPWVERDPTKFCTWEAFETGVEALKTFCDLRAQSVRGQLEGTIPSTSQGQAADSSALVDASGLDLADMGSMGGGGGPG
ncbi:MAG: CotH kinase family protein, partial [Oscillospiraceae bacterium]|nr:CotH kinase family protein [Oscillospiraceae bacterium]